METFAIAVVNGQQIQVSNDEARLVPIKPICQALGVNYTTQHEKLQKHPIFGKAVVPLRGITGSDGKRYEMICLPLEYVFGWIFTINPNNVNESAREAMIRYQEECNHVLYEYFHRKTQKMLEDFKEENRLLEEIAELSNEQQAIKQQISDKKKELNAIRESRLNPQPTLF